MKKERLLDVAQGCRARSRQPEPRAPALNHCTTQWQSTEGPERERGLQMVTQQAPGCTQTLDSWARNLTPCFLLLLFLFLFLPEVFGPEIEPSPSSNLSHGSDNARSLTCLATRELPPLFSTALPPLPVWSSREDCFIVLSPSLASGPYFFYMLIGFPSISV